MELPERAESPKSAPHGGAFDEHAERYDAWFLKNPNVLESEVLLVKHCLTSPGRCLSVGCGTGLFESILRNRWDIQVTHGLEPSTGSAQVARMRGMEVITGVAETLPYPADTFDTVLFNGSPSYIKDLGVAFREAARVLVPGGRVVALDVPKESSYGLLYHLGKALGTWEHKDVEGTKPPFVYPLVFVQEACWRTTPEKVDLLREAGFDDFRFSQTLTRHPKYSDEVVEEPSTGFDRGDYVGIVAVKMRRTEDVL